MTGLETDGGEILRARALSKWYGEVIGLNNFGLDVRRGITGVVGPNGSGKSTLFKLALGLIKPSSGAISMLGQTPWKNPELHTSVGFCPDFESLPLDYTGEEYLSLVGSLHHLKGDALKRRVAEVARLVEMTGATNRKIAGYSKGMKQRMKIAGALIHDPPLLILDEPLSGTDPLVRKELIDLIKRLHEEHDHDVVVSSHVLFEIERMTHDIVLLYKGRAVAAGDISEIRDLIDEHPHNIVIEGAGIGGLAKALLDERFTVSVSYNEERSGVTVQVSRPDEFFDRLPDLIEATDTRVDRMYSQDDNLEAIFKYLVGR